MWFATFFFFYCTEYCHVFSIIIIGIERIIKVYRVGLDGGFFLLKAYIFIYLLKVG